MPRTVNFNYSYLPFHILFAFTGSRILKINVDSYSKDSFTISWTKPSISSNEIDDYRIYYRIVNGNWKTKDIKSGLDNETLTAQVSGLTPGAVYHVKVQIIDLFF